MCGTRWVITPWWLSESLRPLLHSSVYSCYLFLISVRSLPSLFFIVSILAWNVPLIPPVFLKRSLVFPILLVSSICLHCLLKKSFLSLLAVPWNSAFSWVYLSLSPLPFAFLSSAICKASSISHFAALYFFLFGVVLVLPPVQCYEPPSIVLCILPDLIPWIYSSPPLYDYKGFDLGHTWMP